MTIAIFIKLFDINIVARSRFGFSNNNRIFLVSLLLLSSWILDLSREKKATSQPEVNADSIRKINIKVIFTITGIQKIIEEYKLEW